MGSQLMIWVYEYLNKNIFKIDFYLNIFINIFLNIWYFLYRPVSDAALQNLKKSRRVSIAGGDRKKGGF
jgi:hypothetical protein